jgi:dipeptidyl aminopeptidase/acylaminoacyl peptidase
MGTRYPLVLQTHGFEADKFALTGIARNFAAQPLAAHGIFVLQIAENNENGHWPTGEWPTVQAAYEAAIDHLAGLGLIDRTKVGIQGWSWTGVTVGYTLTHSSYPFAAGALTSSADFGWWWYLMAGAPRAVEDESYGVAPFGEGLETWRKMSATFNLDRVGAPMFMWEEGIEGLWDWYTGLRRLGKPVEYWLLPDGVHDVFKVGGRMLTNQLLVDWFCFWLKGEEDPDPAKAEQYARWRELRKVQEKTLENSADKGLPTSH